MVGQPESHRGGAVLRITRLTQGRLRVEPIVGKNRSGEQGIPGGIAFGKGDGVRDEGVATPPCGVRGKEARRAVLDQAPPARHLSP